MCTRLRAGFKETLCFSFTTKSSFKYFFMYTYSLYSVLENVAHFFPLHMLHLDLTFWVLPILLTFMPSQGKLATVVYRLILLGMVRFNGDNQF